MLPAEREPVDFAQGCLDAGGFPSDFGGAFDGSNPGLCDSRRYLARCQGTVQTPAPGVLASIRYPGPSAGIVATATTVPEPVSTDVP